jgi:hypothetical protein
MAGDSVGWAGADFDSFAFLSSPIFESSIPSRILEQLAQMFGFRESASPPTAIGWPQQIQIRGFILFATSR